MKKIDLANCEVSKFRNKYVVFFDTDNRYEFTSYKKAVKFLRSLERKFNQVLFFLNNELIDCYSLFRKHYFVLGNVYHYKTLFDFIEQNIELLLNSKGQNAHYFILKHLRDSLNNLIEIYTMLRKHFKKNSNTIEVYNIDSKMSFITSNLRSIDFVDNNIKPLNLLKYVA
jgi:hypothetical protein